MTRTIVLRERTGIRSAWELYTDWFINISDHFQTFATLSFPRKVSYDYARSRGLKLLRLTNEEVYGRRYREENNLLSSILSVEFKHSRPHIHMMQGKHPLLTPEKYRCFWIKVLGRWISSKAVDIQEIHSKKAVIKYIHKNVTWENLPIIALPKIMSEPDFDYDRG